MLVQLPELPEPRPLARSEWPAVQSQQFWIEVAVELERHRRAGRALMPAALDCDFDALVIDASSKLARVNGWMMVPGMA